MLTYIQPDEFALYYEQLEIHVQAVFPGLGFDPRQIARFLSANSEPFEDSHFLLNEGDQTVAVAMCCDNVIEYVVPGIWDRRYELAVQTIGAFMRIRSEPRIQIKENMPSHNSWYAALLPALGFEMTPRLRMGTDVSSLLQGNAVENVEPYRVVSFNPDWFDLCSNLHLAAYDLPSSQAAEMADNLRDSLGAADRRDSWKVAFQENECVGSCFGSNHKGRLFVEELAVSAAHRQRGLGRRLLLETVTQLNLAFPDSQRVVLDVDRMNAGAVGLYTSLGFVPEDFYTVARAH